MKRDRKPLSVKRLNPPAHAYSILLVSLMALWLIVPFLRAMNVEEVGDAFFITVALISAGYAMSDQGKSFIFVIVLGGLLAATMWFDLASATETKLRLFYGIAGLLFFGVVAFELLLDILSKESGVDMNLINGAIAVYLLIGVCFAYVYQLIFTVDPGAFRGMTVATGETASFIYFSFVTLTTLGYGDISPVTRVGGSFATLEAIVGQLYLTVLVARLVGMHISQRSGA